MCCFKWETQKNVFSFSLANVSRVFRIFYERSLPVFVLWHEKILICGRARNESEVSRARESHVFFFEISLSFFCLRTIKFFSCFSQNRSSSLSPLVEKTLQLCVFRWFYCGVHVRGFCEGVFFNEHNTTRFTKKSREKLFLVSSSFFVGITE